MTTTLRIFEGTLLGQYIVSPLVNEFLLLMAGFVKKSFQRLVPVWACCIFCEVKMRVGWVFCLEWIVWAGGYSEG